MSDKCVDCGNDKDSVCDKCGDIVCSCNLERVATMECCPDCLAKINAEHEIESQMRQNLTDSFVGQEVNKETLLKVKDKMLETLNTFFNMPCEKLHGSIQFDGSKIVITFPIPQAIDE